MSALQWPRPPVSRSRFEAVKRDWTDSWRRTFNAWAAMRYDRDRARARIAELDSAIRRHERRTEGLLGGHDRVVADLELYAVLDSNERGETLRGLLRHYGYYREDQT